MAYQAAFEERAVPLLQREFDSGRCEILELGSRGIPTSHFMDLEAVEFAGNGYRRAALDPAVHPDLLEYRVRVMWLTRECRSRGYVIPGS